METTSEKHAGEDSQQDKKKKEMKPGAESKAVSLPESEERG